MSDIFGFENDPYMPNTLNFDLINNLFAHNLDIQRVQDQLQTGAEGLSKEEADKRLLDFGPNKLDKKKGVSALALFIGQFNDFLVWILLAAGAFSYLIGEKIDAIAIFSIVLINGILGFLQEYKAEQSMEALKNIETLEARVIRDGVEQTIEAEKLVPGDMVVLYEGEKVPADARLCEAYALDVDESMLTGESLPVSKNITTLEKNLALGDKKNMVFSGCMITKGRGRAVVVMTGMRTELGKIAQDIHEAPEIETPLQKALEKLGKTLGIICLGVAIPGLLIGLIAGRDWLEMVMMAISLAVSAIPEGLPIVVTIALALGIRRMVKINVLVRKLTTAESLGGTDVICSDKTGTITHNQMTVNYIYIINGGFCTISGNGYSTDGEINFDEEQNKQFGLKVDDCRVDLLNNILKAAVLCSDATLDFGDPTERALVVALRKSDGTEEQLRMENKRVDEVPFDSATKYMAVAVENGSKKRAIVKGAPEIIIEMCGLTDDQKKHINHMNDEMSEKGLRVLAVAEKMIEKNSEMKTLKNYRLLGLMGMYDPPREEVANSIKVCQRAGVRVLMITGDHKKTAESIAKKIGLKTSKVITGVEIDQMSDSQFLKEIQTVNVFARVSPPHKVKILTTLQKMGHQVAMTGDGVNDAPAIKRADVGIAVGSGTDLTKSISDMIILDDDFSTITKGIKEGRRIFFNIKKFVRYLLSANFDEVAEVFTSILFGLPLSYLPLQILWLNLATDSLPALALIYDVADSSIMDRKPYRPKEEIMKGVLPFSLLAASIAYIFNFGLFLSSIYLRQLPVNYARTLSFTATVLFEFFLVFAIRSEKSASKVGFFSNKLIWLAVLLGVGGQLLTVYTPIGNEIFKTLPIKIADWPYVLMCASSGFVVLECLKTIKSKVPALGKYIPIN